MTRTLAIFVASLLMLLTSALVVFAQTFYEGPGTYSTHGKETYGPNGTQSQYGHQLYTPHGTYSTYGNLTYGPDGTYSKHGNTTYGPGGSTTSSYGKQTYTTTPSGRSVICSHYGNQTYCN
jgi:hypothetical protein